jgi:hypothetical protein
MGELIKSIELTKETGGDIILIAFAFVMIAIIIGVIKVIAEFVKIIIKSIGKRTEKIISGEDHTHVHCENKEVCNPELKLEEHAFFCEMIYIQSEGVTSIDFGGPTRNKMFREMFGAKAEELYNGMKKFIETPVRNDEEWYIHLMNTINKAISNYENRWNAMGIKPIVINKFNAWHQKRVALVKEEIETLFRSKQTSLNEKTKTVLCLLEYVMKMSLIDITNAAWQLNGELTGIEYKGLKIEPLKH